ncbi:MAG TPA: indole-3-glycerol phosphate synthase TrpC [Leptolyngbya sp.]|jgi:indole-3-glycerol phosphate synthase|nr:indole-3-glycerol phosphate synthase TrpC [Leptolyngbya sp.]
MQNQLKENYTKESDTAEVLSPRHVLREIVAHKVRELEQRKLQLPLLELQPQIKRSPESRNFLGALQQPQSRPHLIAEVKKASPSKGLICANFDPVKIAQAYTNGGATCLSVLTDEPFFQGSFENLQRVRQQTHLPLLCKEFIIDPYQLFLARANGADAVLLIAALLPNTTLQLFFQLAQTLGMDALVEVHTLAELDRVLQIPELQLIGINNRNLEDFTLDLSTTQAILEQRGEQLKQRGITIVSESGLYTAADLAFVKQAGADAVLVGESLVKQPNLEQAVKQLLHL